MSRRLSLIIMVVIAAMAVFVPAASSSSTDSQQLTTIRVGTIPITDMAPFYLGIKKGFFRKVGLNPRPTVLQSGPANIAALIGGSLDVGFTASVPLLIAETQNVPLKIAAGVALVSPQPNRGAGTVLVKGDSSIRGVRDLEGKTVAVNALNAIDHVTMLEYLDQQGVDPGSVKFVEVPFPSMQVALAAGRIDAANVGEPFNSAMVKAGFRSLFNPQVALGRTGQISMWITSADYAQKNLPRVIAFARAWKQSVIYANSHLGESRAILASFTELSPDQTSIVKLPWWSSGLNVVSMGAQAQLLQKYKFTTTLANPRDLIIPAVVKALQTKRKKK